MAIPAVYIQELVARNDIVDVIGQYVTLTRAGRLYKGLCPFHNEKTPSFMVYPDTQSYYCFGCGSGGDVIKFTMEINSLTYIEAVKQLAENCGMSMPEDDDQQAKQRQRILSMNKLAAKHFYDNLNSDIGKNARKYLRDRQLSDKTIVNFGLGYAADDWRNLYDFLRANGYYENEIVSAYLATKRENNGNTNVFDTFRNRIMFPIVDLRGNIIAFGGRRLSDAGGPKYLNSSDTPVFKKSNGLFALNLAKKSGKDTFILAEGYMDVIAMHQAGFNNAVATLGTALTMQQARLISDYAKKVVIAYDSDGPGQAATTRALEIFSSLQMNAQVLQIQGAKDPDEFIKKYGAERFQMLIDGSNSAMDFNLIKLLKNYDITQPDQKAEYLTKACELISKDKNQIVQDIYCKKLSEQTGVDAEAIKSRLNHNNYITRKKEQSEYEKKLIKQGNAGQIKVNYAQKGNSEQKVYSSQQIVCAIIKDNSLFDYVNSKIDASKIMDADMQIVYIAFANLYAQSAQVGYSAIASQVPDTASNALSKLLAQNSDIMLSKSDIDRHIDILLSSKLTSQEIQQLSPEEIQQRINSRNGNKK